MTQTGETSTATVSVTDLHDNPCTDGTVVTFTTDPAGSVTFSVSTANTVDGVATVTITAVSTDEMVSITASVLDDEDTALLLIGSSLPTVFQILITPDPDSYPGEFYELPYGIPV